MSQNPMKKFGFTLIELLVVISIIALLLGILVPVLGIAKKNANIMKESVNIRNMNLGMNTYGGTNKDWFPGLNSAGKFSTATAFSGEYYYAANATSQTYSGAASTVASDNNIAIAILLEEGQVAPAQLISPGENGANTTTTTVPFGQATPDMTANSPAAPTAVKGEVTKVNSSYALLQYGLPKLKTEWKSNQNQQAVIAGARLVFADNTGTAAGSKFSTVWTDALSGKYKGAIAHGDNSTNTESFTSTEVTDSASPFFASLKYGSAVFNANTNSGVAVGAFGYSGGATLITDFDATATKGQLGSELD